MKKSAVEIIQQDGKNFYRRKCSVCEEKIIYGMKAKPEYCPKCNSKYWDKPKDERNLFLIQDRYIQEGRPLDILQEMYFPLKEYSGNIIKHRVKNSYRMQPDILEERINDLTNIILEKYLSDPEMQIHSSFGGFLLRVSAGVLYGKRREEEHESLNAKIDENNEIGEKLETIGFTQIHGSTDNHISQDKMFFKTDNSVYGELFEIINKIHKTILSTDSIPSSSLLYLIGLRNRLKRKTEPFMNRYYNTLAGNRIKEDIQKTELLIYNYLKERSYVQ